MQRTNERGAAGIEYGLLVAAIAIVLFAVAGGLGLAVARQFITFNLLLP